MLYMLMCQMTMPVCKQRKFGKNVYRLPPQGSKKRRSLPAPATGIDGVFNPN